MCQGGKPDTQIFVCVYDHITYLLQNLPPLEPDLQLR